MRQQFNRFTGVTMFEVDTMSVTKASGMNILGIVVFSLFLGGVLSKMGKDGAPLVKFFECLHVATMKLVTLVIWYVCLKIKIKSKT